MSEISYAAAQKQSGIKPGFKVKVLRKADYGERGWGFCWIGLMNQSIGKTLVVRASDSTDGFQLSDGFWYPYFALEIAKK